MISINIFCKYSIHIGHSASNSIFLSSWFFFKLRKRVWIINLFKTIIFIKLVFKFLKYIATFNLPFWFINLELSKEYLFKKYALACGEFACTKMWIRGFLSNFKRIQRNLVKYIFKRHLYKFNEKQNLLQNWSITRFSWPRGAFLSNIPINYVICKEAASILLPVVALVDTDIKSFLFTLPLPSNDDSIDSINFILSLISKKLLLYKYKKVLSWYQNYKDKKKKIISKYIYLKNYLNTYLKKRYKYYKNKRKKKRFFFSFIHKYKSKKLKFTKLTEQSKINLRKYMFSGSFWKTVTLYSQMALLKSKKFKKKIFFKFLNKATKFFKNCDAVTTNIYQKFEDFNSINSVTNSLIKSYQKSKYLRKLNVKNCFYKKFLLFNNLNLKQHPLYLYARSIRLKYLRPRFRKRLKSLKKMYSYYYFISNNLRKSRTFHESFFWNLPSKFTFLRAFHKYEKPAWYKDDAPYARKWYWYNENYRYLLNDRSQRYWATNRHNTMLLKYWKYNKKLSIADSAIIFILNRWIPDRRVPMAMKNAGRMLLPYWLYPMFRRFSVKDKNRWYSSKFFYKEDTKFLQHFNWNWSFYKTPSTTFHYYNNWFGFLLKDKIYPKKKMFNLRKIEIWRKWKRLLRIRAWKKKILKRRAKLKLAKLKLAKLKLAKLKWIKKTIKNIQKDINKNA